MSKNTTKISILQISKNHQRTSRIIRKCLRTCFWSVLELRERLLSNFWKTQKITIFIIFDVIFGALGSPAGWVFSLKLTKKGISRFFVIFLETFPREIMRYCLGLKLCCVKGLKVYSSVEGPILPEGPLKDDATEECFAPHLSEALKERRCKWTFDAT